MPGRKITQVTNEKLKYEEQRGNTNINVYACLVSIAVYYVYALSYSSIFFYYDLLFQPSCFEVIRGNAYMTVCFRYLPWRKP